MKKKLERNNKKERIKLIVAKRKFTSRTFLVRKVHRHGDKRARGGGGCECTHTIINKERARTKAILGVLRGGNGRFVSELKVCASENSLNSNRSERVSEHKRMAIAMRDERMRKVLSHPICPALCRSLI
jgi:hypothetical protein